MPHIHRMAEKRMALKAGKIKTTLEQNDSDWQETTWKTLASAYGLTLNTTPMEWLSNTVSLKQLSRIGIVFSIEAALLGQAGFLEKDFSVQNEYAIALQKEYQHLKNKYSLKPISIHSWKYSPIRPPAFPEIRIAQLAALVAAVPDIFNSILHLKGLPDCYQLFCQPVSDFWKSHCRLETEKQYFTSGIVGKNTVDVFVINAVIPLLYSFSENTGNSKYAQTGLDLFKSIEPEQNKIIDIFVRNAGAAVSSAFETQGLIELYNTLCSASSCMLCPIMTELTRTTSHE